MINGKPLISYDSGLAAQSSKKAAKDKLPVKGLDFASFIPSPGNQPKAVEQAGPPRGQVAQRIESAAELLPKRPSIQSKTAPITGRNDISMLPKGPNAVLGSAAARATGGHSTLSGRPAMLAPDALALQAQGLAQDKVQQNFQGMGLADGSKNLASHGLLSQKSGKGAFSPEVAAQLEARLTGEQQKISDRAGKPRAQAGRALENSPQPLRAVNSLNELRARQLKPVTHPKARAQKLPAEGMIGNSPLLAGESTQALLRSFQELRHKIERKSTTETAGAEHTRTNELGSLAARFESGSEGIAAIGYDRHGGTSYGKYQMSSRAGTVRSFIKYLDKIAPDLGNRLRSAGSANTGSKRGKMPDTWKQIAAEQPARFEKLQEDFIRKSHLEPAMVAVTKTTGLGFSELSPALQEVVFSTAVQHGPGGASRILNRAASRVDIDKLGTEIPKQEQVAAQDKLIRNIYSIRSTQFGSSSARVQSSVKNRLRQEMNAALEMLKA